MDTAQEELQAVARGAQAALRAADLDQAAIDDLKAERDEASVLARFTYYPPTIGQADRSRRLRLYAKNFARLILDLAPDSRERSLAFTKLEEAVMWANASISREGNT